MNRPAELEKKIAERQAMVAAGSQCIAIADYQEDLDDRRELRELETMLKHWRIGLDLARKTA